jgi:NAD(P)-dependent dehydrogenase (short-subunit alcohol dehydrogenase family)
MSHTPEAAGARIHHDPGWPVALITGGSRGLGRALVAALVRRGWQVVTDGRDAAVLSASHADLPRGSVIGLARDVASAAHREALAGEVARLGRLDLLVNNASTLGPSPLPGLAAYPQAALADVFAVNTLAPLALVQRLLPELEASDGVLVSVSSDAAVEPYEGWGGYGASKAALDHLTAVLGVENPRVRCYAFDPGDMRTQMHQDAFPGEDISDRPRPDTVVPTLLRLIDELPPSGRYRAADLVDAGPARRAEVAR